MTRGLKKGMTNNPDGRPTKSEKGARKERIGCRLAPEVADLYNELLEQGYKQTDIVNKGIELFYYSVKNG